MAQDERAAIAQASLELPTVSVQDFSDDLMSLMHAADVVLCMGGYNTVCELLTLGRRGVVVPRVKPVQEQAIRAERMAARGLLRTLHPDELEPAALWRVLLAELRSRAPLQRLESMQGLERVTAAVFDAIGIAPPGGAHGSSKSSSNQRVPAKPAKRDRSWHPPVPPMQ